VNKKQWILLLVILVIATILRFIQLGETPQGFYRDESALGYNAYSLMETGKDEFGKKWPILFRSFNDFKTPIYTYLLIPMYKVFGMTAWSTRVLSAAMGVIGIWFCFLLIKNISKSINLALISALFLAISPWHLIFSRTSYETNVAFTFFVISLWSFYKFKQNNKFLIIAAIMAALSFLTYHSERVIVPLVFLVLFLNENKSIFSRKNLKITIIALTLGFILILPTLRLMTTPGFLSRLNSLSILSKNVKQPWAYDENLTGFKSKVFNNNLLLQIREFSSLYTSYFSPRYLFGLGDPEPRTSYPDLAPLLFWQLPFLIIGLIWFFSKTKKESHKLKFLLVTIMLISPIPASITRDPFSSTRALPLVLPLSILVASGIYTFLNKYKKIGIMILVCLILWSLGKIYLSVFKFNDYFRGRAWQNGVEKMIAKIESENLPIMIDNRGDIYSQILFFTGANPKEYQKNNFEVSEHDYYTNMNRNKVKKINNITIKSLDWGKDTQIEQILVGDALAISDTQIKEHCLTKVFEIKDLNDKVLFAGLKTNPKLKKEKGMCF
jgi:4-amino-4-deoxy-L-arabinose transferase-like glycosyltransferase